MYRNLNHTTLTFFRITQVALTQVNIKTLQQLHDILLQNEMLLDFQVELISYISKIFVSVLNQER